VPWCCGDDDDESLAFRERCRMALRRWAGGCRAADDGRRRQEPWSRQARCRTTERRRMRHRTAKRQGRQRTEEATTNGTEQAQRQGHRESSHQAGHRATGHAVRLERLGRGSGRHALAACRTDARPDRCASIRRDGEGQMPQGMPAMLIGTISIMLPGPTQACGRARAIGPAAPSFSA